MTTRTGSPILRSGESGFLRAHRLDCAVLSAAGTGRPHNDDCVVFAAPGTAEAEAAAAGYLFAAIDGEPKAGVTRSAARETRASLLEILDDPRCVELRPDLLLHRLDDANTRSHERIGTRCVVTALWIWEEPGGGSLVAAWAHVGDTRLYVHDGREWRRPTRDHARGRLLDRAVGQGPGLEIDRGRLTLSPGNRLVLVTAGVWRTTPPPASIEARQFPPAAEAVRRIVGQARLNGSRDDTTAIVIAVGRAGDAAEPEH